MSDRSFSPARLEDVAVLTAAIGEVVDAAVKSASALTGEGNRIDDYQVHSERIAYAATELEACKALTAYARAAAEARAPDAALYVEQAAVYVGEVAAKLYGAAQVASQDFNLPDGLLGRTLGSAAVLARIGDYTAEARVRAVGLRVAESRGANNSWLPSEDVSMVRDSVRASKASAFARPANVHQALAPLMR